MHTRGGGVGACVPRGGAMGLCRGEVSCTIKDEGEKRGNDLSEVFLRCTRHSEGDGSRVACVCPRRM